MTVTKLSYEEERALIMERNQRKLAELGIKSASQELQAACQTTSTSSRQRSTPRKGGGVAAATTRTSRRVRGAAPASSGLTDDFREPSDGRRELLEDVTGGGKEGSDGWRAYLAANRCGSKARGSVYDTVAGICCHFCRQKKLCGELDCPRCEARDQEKQCIGKSECSKCGSGTGRFCRACLAVRYGQDLADVRAAMAEGTWLCPHCYEAEHPDEGWICNSSICMTRRGLMPTGIAIFKAQAKGFPSVAHWVQAKLLAGSGKGRGDAAAEGASAAVPSEEPVGGALSQEVTSAIRDASVSRQIPLVAAEEATIAAVTTVTSNSAEDSVPATDNDAADLNVDNEAVKEAAANKTDEEALKDEEDLPLAARRCGRHQPKKKWDSPECPAARAYTNRRASKRVLAPQPPPVVV